MAAEELRGLTGQQKAGILMMAIGEDRAARTSSVTLPPPRPARDLDPEAITFHERASTAVRDILFKNAGRVRPTLECGTSS